MSLATTLHLARAVTSGVTQQRRQYRHVHLTDAPLLGTTTFLAGEPVGCFAIAACRFGRQPELWVISEPRDRDLRDAVLAEFHLWLLDEVAEDEQHGRTTQLIVPNPAEADAFARLGRLHRYQRQQPPLYPPVAVAGAQLLTVLTSQRDVPGSALCLDATTELQRLYVPPMSPPECAHLGALVAAIDPPHGMHAQDAALAAERTSMGLIPDPAFDNSRLQPALEAYNASRAEGRAAGDVDRLASQLTAIGHDLVRPKLAALNHAVALLAAAPEAPSAAVRFSGTGDYDYAVPADARELSRQLEKIRSGTTRLSKRLPSHVQAAHVARAEAVQQVMAARELYEDPLAFAEAVVDGRAWTGQIIARDDTHRTVPPGKIKCVKRPLVTARSDWPLLFPPGTRLRWADDPDHIALEILSIETDGPATTVELQVVQGMDHWLEAPPSGQLRVAEASPVPPSCPPGVESERWEGGHHA